MSYYVLGYFHLMSYYIISSWSKSGVINMFWNNRTDAPAV